MSHGLQCADGEFERFERFEAFFLCSIVDNLNYESTLPSTVNMSSFRVKAKYS